MSNSISKVKVSKQKTLRHHSMPMGSLVRSADHRTKTGTSLHRKLRVEKMQSYENATIEPHSFDDKRNSPHLNKLTLIDSN